ncbi:alpha/beta fold hydrolase [Candidatus Peregrinibacteria bacterium]|nr:alpha/beta fold hydrolase [Candidatus Peregrinibacteria bacterium]
METVKFQTTDLVTIVGDFVNPAGAKKAVLLLHMMPETRGSWTALSSELNKAGLATLAIDLRGHGESNKQLTTNNLQQINYQSFSDKEHQASRLDVDAAMNFLKSKGFAEENIFVAGASIGANLTLDAMYRYKEISRGVLLSPGLDYRGVKTESAMKQLSATQKIWIIAAKADEYSAESTKTLAGMRPDIAKSTIFSGSDHGTNLFKSQKTLIQEIVKFFQ